MTIVHNFGCKTVLLCKCCLWANCCCTHWLGLCRSQQQTMESHEGRQNHMDWNCSWGGCRCALPLHGHSLLAVEDSKRDGDAKEVLAPQTCLFLCHAFCIFAHSPPHFCLCPHNLQYCYSGELQCGSVIAGNRNVSEPNTFWLMHEASSCTSTHFFGCTLIDKHKTYPLESWHRKSWLQSWFIDFNRLTGRAAEAREARQLEAGKDIGDSAHATPAGVDAGMWQPLFFCFLSVFLFCEVACTYWLHWFSQLMDLWLQDLFPWSWYKTWTLRTIHAWLGCSPH